MGNPTIKERPPQEAEAVAKERPPQEAEAVAQGCCEPECGPATCG
jgi:hypothetical protein